MATTTTGPSTFDKLLDTWLSFQAIEHQADVETLSSGSGNIPDRVDVASGETGANAPPMANPQLLWIAVVAGAVVLLVLALKG